MENFKKGQKSRVLHSSLVVRIIVVSPQVRMHLGGDVTGKGSDVHFPSLQVLLGKGRAIFMLLRLPQC